MYVVVGANGYLGTYFIKNILERSEDPIIAVARHPGKEYGNRVRWVSLDITDREAVQAFNEEHLRTNESNRIIYLAAYHHPDLVEKNFRLAWDTNVTSLSYFLNLAEHVDWLVYPSSDSVYGESRDRYAFRETDPLRPVNRYGEQKCVAEKLVTAYGYHVVRFPFLIAPSLVPGKKHFYDVIADTLRQGKTMEMFSDSYRSSLSFDTAAQLTLDLMEKSHGDVPQIVNVCGDEALSKYDVGLRIAERLGTDKALVKPILIQESSGIFSAKRATSTLMDNTLLKKLLGKERIRLEIG